jgi:hypothetical protein
MTSDNMPKGQGTTPDSPSTPDLVEERREFLRKVSKTALAGAAVTTLVAAGAMIPTRAANAYGGKPPGKPPGGGPLGGNPPGGKPPGGKK